MLLEYKPTYTDTRSADATGLMADPSIRRILIVKWSAMGDVILATAMFEDVRKAFPSAELHLNTHPRWFQLFEADPRFTAVFGFDFKQRGSRLRNTLAWLKKLKEGAYDLIIDLQSNQRSRNQFLLLKCCGLAPPHLLGVHKRIPYTIYPEESHRPLNAFSRLRQALRAGGIPTTTLSPTVFVPKRNWMRVASISKRHELHKDYAVFLPGSQAAGHLKRWGAANYAALGKILLKKGIKKIVLVGGPDELEECGRIQQMADSNDFVNLCGHTELRDLVPLCQSARFIVGNDTGTAHIAAASGRPLLVICGPTDPRKVLPAGRNVWSIQANIDCINCYRKECSHKSCMQLITAPKIVASLSSRGLID